MRKFTKSILALALIMVGAMNANAEKLYSDFSEISAGGGASWNAETKTMGWSGNWGNAVAYFMIKGIDNVGGYYDLSSWETITVTFSLTGNTNGVRIRMKDNTGGDGDWILMPEGTNTLKITDFKKGGAALNYSKIGGIQLSGGNNTTEESTAIFTELYLERPDDPLAIPKDNLTKAIALGNAQNSFAKTAASFAVLTDAITDGVAELANASATVESLNAATQAIAYAIAGLKYSAGYARVTKNMFMEWDGDGADAKALRVSPAGADNIGVADAGVPYGYGTGQVFWNHYTDLTPYEKLYALGTPAGNRARYLFNRPQDPDNPTGEGTAAFIQQYVAIDENGIAELVLSDVSTEFVHLNTFKRPDGGTTFTDFIVYAANSKATVGAAGYATFSSIMNVDMTGVTAYAAKVNGVTVALTPVAEVPANNAVIIEAAAGTYNLTNIESAAAIADNDLKISDGSVAGNGTIFVLAKKEKGIGFYKLANGEKVPAGKGYLVIDSNAPEFLGFGGDATGINEVKAVEAKGEFFNLAGQRVAQPAKGLYIANGKKVIIK